MNGPSDEEPVPPTQLGFADQAYLGKNGWWRYVLALGLLLLGIYACANALAYGFARYAPYLLNHGYIDRRTAPLLDFAMLMLSEISALPLMAILFVSLHRRPWRSFLTARPRFDGPLFWRSLLVMFVLGLGSLGLTFVFDPAGLTVGADLRELIIFAPLALVLLPLQCLAEEVLFRGYLAQAVGRVSRAFALRLLVPALLFAAAHGANPEMSYDRVWVSATYGLLALYLGFISLRGGGLEASFGAHLANNVHAALIAGSSISASPGPTIWKVHDVDFKTSFFSTALLLGLHYLLVFRPWAKARP